MATPKLKYGLGNAASTTLASGISDSDTSAPLTSDTNFQEAPTPGEGMALLDEGNATEELAYSTGLAGGALTIPLDNRGEEGGSAQPHSAQASVKGTLSVGMWNDLVESLVNVLVQSTGAVDTTKIVTLTATQTLTDKTLTNAVLETPDLNGTKATLDADGDTSITADTDDQIDFEVGGSDAFRMKSADFDLAGTNPNVTVGGADPWRTITLMPGFLKPTTTAGCADSETVEAGTNDIDYDVLAFDASSDESAFANFQMPESWDGGVIQFRVIWTNASGGSSETVEFELAGRSYANDDAIDQAVGTAVGVSDTWIAQGDVHVSDWSDDVTLAGTPAAGEFVHIEVTRDVSDDTLTGDARLIALQIRYKQAQYSD